MCNKHSIPLALAEVKPFVILFIDVTYAITRYALQQVKRIERHKIGIKTLL